MAYFNKNEGFIVIETDCAIAADLRMDSVMIDVSFTFEMFFVESEVVAAN